MTVLRQAHNKGLQEQWGRQVEGLAEPYKDWGNQSEVAIEQIFATNEGLKRPQMSLITQLCTGMSHLTGICQGLFHLRSYLPNQGHIF